jgi:hypothetical protein
VRILVGVEPRDPHIHIECKGRGTSENEGYVTIYELTQAIARYKRAVFIGLGVIFVAVIFMMFTYNDGGIEWRGGLKYESSFEISVVTPGTDTLGSTDPTDVVSGAASEYAGLLTTGEAAEVVGDMSGYTLDEPMKASTEQGSGVIVGTVIGPSPELAMAASQNAFVWLAQKIQQPLNAQPEVTITVPPAPDVSLEGDFVSSLSVAVDPSLASVSPDLFVLVDVGGSESAAVPVAERAGESVDSTATLEAGGSILLRLETASGIEYDSLRLAPGPLPAAAPAYPTLTVTLGPDAIDETSEEAVDDNGDPTSENVWVFDSTEIATEWIDGDVPAITEPETTVRQVQVALITEVPTALQIGGRRGPLLGFAVLIVGLILLLTAVIVADTWRRSRDEADVSSLRVPHNAATDQPMNTVPADEPRTSSLEVPLNPESASWKPRER